MVGLNSHTNNHIKFKWSKHPNYKTEMVGLDKKERPNYMMSTRNILNINPGIG